MSRNGSLLPIPPELQQVFDIVLVGWPQQYVGRFAYPRSVWLREAEAILRSYYPTASTADLALTARTYAPFALAQPGQR